MYGDKIKHISDKFSIANLLRLMLTFAIVNFAWIFFRVSDLSEVMSIFRKIFTEPGSLFIDADTLVYAFIFAVIVFVTDFVDEFFTGKVKLLNSRYAIIRWSTYIAMAVMILLFGVLDGGSFIYFQF